MSAYAVSARGLVSRRIPQGVLASMNALLFGSGEQGAWYDPSDLSTLFQDSAGTTPVTAVEQPVGRMLDKSGNGNHASQATTTKRGVVSRRVNLFTESEFRNGITDAPVRGGALTATTMAGFLGALHFGGTNTYAYKGGVAGMVGIPIVISVVVEMDDGLPPVFASSAAASGSNDFALALSGSALLDARQHVVKDLGGGRYRVSAELTLASAGNGSYGVTKYSGNSPRTFKATAYDVRLAIDAHLPYQWVNTATDYDDDPNKFPTYIRFDGVDDVYQTNSIGFAGTGKMTVWAGYICTKTTNTNLLVELSDISVNPGAFSVFPRIADGRGLWSIASPQAVCYSASDHAYRTVIQSVGYDRAGGSLSELIAPRIDGALIAPGEGSFYTPQNPYFAYGRLNIGARNDGTTHFFGGRLYGLIVRGAQTPLSQIEAAELYIKQNMRMP